MALDFPASPAVNDTYTANNVTWTWDGVSWNASNYLVGTGTGNGTDTAFFINGQTVNTSFTTSATKNYLSAGPVAVSTGITVTVTTGSRWVIS